MKKRFNNQSRSIKVIINIIADLLLQLVTIICGFVLPKLILSNFGSTYNGVVHSITQFIGCVELLKSGIGSVTRASLYKPLAENNYNEVSKIVLTTENFLRKISFIFLVSITFFSFIYPFIINEDLPFYSIVLLVLILSISTFAQYFFGLAYQMVLQADQKNYVISFVQIFTIIVNTLVSYLLIILGFSIHIVKLGSALVFIIPPLFYLFYVRKKYKLKRNVKINNNLISQRWDAFGHQIANFINLNVDVIVITIFLKISEVSVYSIYNMIAYSLRKIITSITSSITGAIGNIYAKNESEVLLKSFKQYEHLIYFISTVIYITAAILILPFISIYTFGIEDTNYIRPLFSIFICIACFFSCVKLPYETIVYVAGKFKETKKAAYIESFINIFISCLLVKKLGIVGIMIGTICAGFYRLLFYSYYVSKNIVRFDFFSVFFKLIFSFISAIICFALNSFINVVVSSYFYWILYAILVFLFVLLCTTTISFIMFKKETCDLFTRIRQLLF